MSEEVHNSLTEQLRIGLTVASQLGERIARIRRDILAETARRSLEQQRLLQARFDTELRSAERYLAAADRGAWWDRAEPAAIADMYQTAAAWAPNSPTAAAATQTIAAEVADRYGLDITVAANPRDTLVALDEAARAHAEADRRRAQAETGSVYGAALMTQADALERDAEAARAEAQERAERVDWETGDPDSIRAFQIADEADRNATDLDAQVGALREQGSNYAASSADESARAVSSDREAADAHARASAAAGTEVPWDSVERRAQLLNGMRREGVGESAITARMTADQMNAQSPDKAVAAPRAARASKAKAYRAALGRQVEQSR